MKPHVHAAPAKNHTFSFEAQALFNCGISPELDFSAGTNDPMPGKVKGSPKNPDHLPGCAGMPSSFGNRSVRRNVSPGNRTNGFDDTRSHGFNSSFHRIRFLDSRATRPPVVVRYGTRWRVLGIPKVCRRIQNGPRGRRALFQSCYRSEAMRVLLNVLP